MSLCYSAILVLGLFKVIVLVHSQFLGSPCPDIFEYRSDGSGVYGVIRLKFTGESVSMVQIVVNYTIAVRLNSNYAGRLQLSGNSINALQDFNRGVPLEYRLDFPVTSPLPRVTSIYVNDVLKCYGPGDVPSPTQYVTTASLQHTLFLKGQPSPGYYNQFDVKPQSNPNSVFDLIESLPNDGQVYMFGGNSDRTGSWNSEIDPFFEIKNPQPQYEQSAPRPPTRPAFEQPVRQPPVRPQFEQPAPRPPSRPQIQYYPELNTQPPQQLPPSPPVQTPPLRVPETSSAPIQCGVVSGGNERLPLIYNGQSYQRGDWPWLVAIYKRKDGSLSFICSGTLVSDRHVVTAAHCMQQKNTYSSNKDIVVKVGVYNLEDWGDDITVTRTLASSTIHESYNASSLANDILVLTFERTVEFNTNIRPACLWSGNPDLSRIVGASGVVAGWGQSERGAAGRGEPRVIRVPVVSTAVCRASRPDFHKLTSSKTLCAGDRNGSGPCLGDSGGGLYLLEGGRWQLRGIVSLSLRADNGDSTCNLNEYIVFTDSAKYADWIKSVMSRY